MFLVSYEFAKRPLPPFESCGDTCLIIKDRNNLFFALIDASGHGQHAQAIAWECEAFFETHFREDLVDQIGKLNNELLGSAGAVLNIGRLNLKNGILEITGIGNVRTRFFSPHHKKLRRFHVREGVLGVKAPKASIQLMKLGHGDGLLLYSDGVEDSFELEDYPAIVIDTPQTVIKTVMNRYAKDTDDASCLMVRVE